MLHSPSISLPRSSSSSRRGSKVHTCRRSTAQRALCCHKRTALAPKSANRSSQQTTCRAPPAAAAAACVQRKRSCAPSIAAAGPLAAAAAAAGPGPSPPELGQVPYQEVWHGEVRSDEYHWLTHLGPTHPQVRGARGMKGGGGTAVLIRVRRSLLGWDRGEQECREGKAGGRRGVVVGGGKREGTRGGGAVVFPCFKGVPQLFQRTCPLQR